MINLQSDFEEKLNTVKNNYLKSLNEKYTVLKALKDLICKDENLINAFHETYGYIHKLSGSSAMFGFQELGQVSNKLELLLAEFIKSNYSSDKKVISETFEILLNEIEKIIKKD
jgi:chemotaxis protein histidine kinase CheA